MASFQKNSDPFDVLADSLEAHPSKAQILVEITSTAHELNELIAFLRSLGFHQIERRILSKGIPSCVLLYLPIKDVTRTVYDLIEAGYVKVKGMNPQKKGNRISKS